MENLGTVDKSIECREMGTYNKEKSNDHQKNRPYPEGKRSVFYIIFITDL